MQDIRWKQRHSNYSNILKVLNSNIESKALKDFSEIEKIGLSKSFELGFELLWKLLKDYLEYENIEIGFASPKNILKAAAEKGLLQLMDIDGDILMKAHKVRNELVHIYDHEKSYESLLWVKEFFLSEMLKVDMYFKELGAKNE